MYMIRSILPDMEMEIRKWLNLTKITPRLV